VLADFGVIQRSENKAREVNNVSSMAFLNGKCEVSENANTNNDSRNQTNESSDLLEQATDK
jgi:hypothetical protein